MYICKHSLNFTLKIYVLHVGKIIILYKLKLTCTKIYIEAFFISSVQSLSRVRLFATLWTAAHQASLSITNSWSLLKFMSIESVLPSN